ncbi:MAG: HAD-IA family hydrolase [Alphaproteobacteria bacterium]
MSFEVIVFDCDGTLVDSGAMILAAMADAFEGSGLTAPAPAAVRQVIGLSLDEAVRALGPELAPDVQAALARRYRVAFSALRADARFDEPLFAGIAELLAELDAGGRRLAIATGKSRRGVDHLLVKHGLDRRFVSVQTADGNPSKPHPEMLRRAVAEAGGTVEAACMIGDTTFDMEMAELAGVAAIGVGWGYHGPAQLTAAGARAVAADAAALGRLLAP